MLNVYSFSKLFWSMHKEFLRICSQYTMKPIEQCWWSELEYKFDIYELFRYHTYKKGFPHSSVSKESACNAGYLGLIPALEISPEVWRRKWQSTPIFLRGESHGQKSLAGYSLWGHRVEHHLATKPPPPLIKKTVNMAAKILELCVYLLIMY